MVTKHEIADLIIAQKSGGDASIQNKIDRREVYKYVDIVVGTLIAAEYEKNVARGSYSLNGDWVSTYDDVPIYESKKRKIKYAILPADLISLPGDRGLHMVAPQEDQSSPFIMIDGNSVGVFKDLEASYMPGKRTCYVEENRIYFPSLPTGCCAVLVKMIAGTDKLDEDKAIPIPAITRELLVQHVSALLETQVKWKTKMINDNNPNTA